MYIIFILLVWFWLWGLGSRDYAELENLGILRNKPDVYPACTISHFITSLEFLTLKSLPLDSLTVFSGVIKVVMFWRKYKTELQKQKNSPSQTDL